MKRTVYLPEDLERRVEEYLRERPDTTLSGLVQEALRRQVTRPDPAALLDLIGLVPNASTRAGERAEDVLVREER